MFSEIKNIGLIVLTCLALALGVGIWLQTERLSTANTVFTELSSRHKTLADAYERALVRAETDRKALVARQAEIALQARKFAQQKHALQNALSAAEQWAATQVPPDVQKALQRPPDALPAVPDGVPNPATDHSSRQSTPASGATPAVPAS
jgi:hypothetical protein